MVCLCMCFVIVYTRCLNVLNSYPANIKGLLMTNCETLSLELPGLRGNKDQVTTGEKLVVDYGMHDIVTDGDMH